MGTRGGKGGSGYLFGVEAERAYEGAVLMNRESSGDGLRGEVVAEAGLVDVVVAGDRVLHVREGEKVRRSKVKTSSSLD